MAESSTPSNKRLGEILIEKGLLTEEKLAQLLKRQQQENRRLGEILIEEGILDAQRLADLLAESFQLPRVHLTEAALDETALDKISIEIMRRHEVFPLKLNGQRLQIAMANPLNVELLQELQYLTGCFIEPVLAAPGEIQDQIERYVPVIESLQAVKMASDEATQEGRITRLVDSIIQRAIAESASDIHLQPLSDRLRVRFRIDGVLYERLFIPKALERRVISRIKVLSDMDVAETRRPQDGRMAVSGQNVQYDVRVSSLPDINGENLVLRLLRKTFERLDFEVLGMDEAQKDFVLNLLDKPYGMILLTGPTGAGKTTTLYAMLQRLNDPGRSIITVEDPVEYKIDGLNQTNINVKAGYTFASALRNILRHDPDVIMVGEIRDLETAEIAIRAALTGHLVLSTLHTNTAAGALTRMADMGIEPFLLSSAILGVVAQRLVRRICPQCREPQRVDQETRELIRRQFPDAPLQFELYKGRGCRACAGTGYQGRIAIYENFPVDEMSQRIILRRPSEGELKQIALNKGFLSLRMVGWKKAIEGVTTKEEVLRVTFPDETGT